MTMNQGLDRNEPRRTRPEDPNREGVERELLAAASEALAGRTEELRQQRELFEVTLASIGDGVITTDARGYVTYLNPVAESMTGWYSDQASGQPIERVLKIIDEDTQAMLENSVSVALRSGRIAKLPVQCSLIARHGKCIPIEDSAAPIRDAAGRTVGAVVVLHDVSVARSKTQIIAHQAHHDGLTDLPNRLLFHDRLNQAIAMAHRYQQQLALLFLDLDGFKHINDSLGHEIGDRVLQWVAQRLLKCVRNSDTVSRRGGDEFVILLMEVNPAQDIEVCAEKLLSALGASCTIDEHEIDVRVSIGIATYPHDADSAETLTRNADRAMYRAKQSGGNTYRFFSRG